MMVASRMITPAHRRRAALPLVRGRTFGPDHLADLAGPEPADDRRADDERQQDRRDRGARGAKADVVEEIEKDVMLAQRGEQVIEHGASVGRVVLSGEVGKYTFERDAAGCLEHHQLVARQPGLEQRRPSYGRRARVSSRSLSRAA